MSDDGTNLESDNTSTRGVELPELLDRLRRDIFANARSWIPAKVERWDASQGQVDCQVLVKDFHRDETGALVVAPVPIVASVPVSFLQAGGFVYYVPIAVGTIGALHFAERSLDAWLSSQGQAVDPGLYSRFNLTDAYFVPGPLPFGTLPTLPDHMFAGKAGGVGVHFRDSTVTIGDESGSKAIVVDGDSVNAGALSGTVLVGGSPVAVQFTYTPVVGVPVGPSPSAILNGGKVSASTTQGKAH